MAEQAEPTGEREKVMERLKMLQKFYSLLDSVVEVVLRMKPGQLEAVVEMFKLLSPGKGREGNN